MPAEALGSARRLRSQWVTRGEIADIPDDLGPNAMKSRCEAHDSVDLAWLSGTGAYDDRTKRAWTYSSGLRIAAYLQPWAAVLEVAGNSHRIALTYTATRFGGRRQWFSCPRCQTARRVLYFSKDGFACRQCLDLRYESEREDGLSRHLRRHRKLRKRLGSHIKEPFPAKPKRMRWKRYRELEARDRQMRAGLAAAFASSSMSRSLERIRRLALRRAERGC
ncbi:hypothetical protein [Hyphomicrobium sp. CS1BSMeth3]|uniref:hypothetical protein n=1 Tax=Hyphomicrobium sp. CS1BSMeth3 TaxID=1892844 RepID=UPI000930C7FE|nr:hypothetical protein [Hyphomicrobium sp. CS1BSMeth3]